MQQRKARDMCVKTDRQHGGLNGCTKRNVHLLYYPSTRARLLRRSLSMELYVLLIMRKLFKFNGNISP